MHRAYKGARVKVIGREKLATFAEKHAQAAGPMEAWLAEAEEASWETTQDVKNRYASASFLSGNRVLFNIGGNKFRLAVVIAYRTSTVSVLWIGTHAEYSQKKF